MYIETAANLEKKQVEMRKDPMGEWASVACMQTRHNRPIQTCLIN